ncbi:MAG TPA: dockerin [Polyangia bacterium]|nr:dockerin [Polyangia bacterium]
MPHRCAVVGLVLPSVALAIAWGAAGCSSSPSKSTPDAGGDASTVNVAWDWVGIVGTGQSLSVGGNAPSVTATTQPYDNLKLSFGGATVAPPFDPTIASLALVPLVEPIRPLATTYPSAYPDNIYGETPHTAMANQITALARQASQDYLTVHTVVGEDGQALTVIEKNPTNLPTTGTSGRAYDATLFEAAAITRLAAAAGKSYGIGAIVMTHGESDAGNSAYDADLYQLLTDYNQDLSAITGQTAKIPMLLSQQNSVPTTTGSVAVSALQQWQAGLDHPGEIVCTGPKYQYSYATDSTHVHLDATGYDELGEKYGQVYFERAVLGTDWQPLQPASEEVSGNLVTVHFHVPVPPLSWDDTLPAPHGSMIPEWAPGRGFEVIAANARQTITSVDIVGDDAVQITCGEDLTGLTVVVGYAATAEGGTPPAAQPAYWGQLRDSDPFVGTITGVSQPNYCVAFQLTVN